MHSTRSKIEEKKKRKREMDGQSENCNQYSLLFEIQWNQKLNAQAKPTPRLFRCKFAIAAKKSRIYSIRAQKMPSHVDSKRCQPDRVELKIALSAVLDRSERREAAAGSEKISRACLPFEFSIFKLFLLQLLLPFDEFSSYLNVLYIWPLVVITPNATHDLSPCAKIHFFFSSPLPFMPGFVFLNFHLFLSSSRCRDVNHCTSCKSEYKKTSNMNKIEIYISNQQNHPLTNKQKKIKLYLYKINIKKDDWII